MPWASNYLVRAQLTFQEVQKLNLDHFNDPSHAEISPWEIPEANRLNFEPTVPCLSLLGYLKNCDTGLLLFSSNDFNIAVNEEEKLCT